MTGLTIARRAPGPRGDFLLGSLGEFRKDPLGLLLNSALRFGDITRFKIGPVLAHLVNHPDHVGYVLVQNAHNFDKQTRSVAKIRATCGRSLLSTDGEIWLRHRRLIQPTFQPELVKRFVPVVHSETSRILDRWTEAARTQRPLNIVSEMMQVTLAIAARSLFGAEIARDAATVESSLAVILNDTWRRLESWFDPASLSPVMHRRSFRTALQSIDEIVYRMIGARRQQTDGCHDLLSILIEAHDNQRGTRLDDQELRDACITLLLAGHETTANALAWCCYLISQDPVVQEELYDESAAVLQHRPPAATDVDKLIYTGKVFAEAIRLYPSIWIMERRVVADDEVAGYALPKDSTLLISPYVLHRHPEFWPDPGRFDPERFSPEASEERPQFAYLPFGAGAHQCVGRHMALLVARLVLATIFQQFRLCLVPGQSIRPLAGITLRHAQPLYITLVENQ